MLLYLYDTGGVHNSQKLLTATLSLSHTGILPTWNWICTLGTDSPCKFCPYWKWKISLICFFLKANFSDMLCDCFTLHIWKYFFSMQEYTKSQIVGLVNLVATMKGWKRKNRLDVLEKIEWAGMQLQLHRIFIGSLY